MRHRTRLLALWTVSVLTLVAILAALTPAFLAAHSVIYAQETLAAPALTADATDATTVELSWTEVDGAARYELWAWDRVNDWYRLGGDSLTGTAYTHGGLTTGTAYYYQVRALGAGGAEGPWSQRVSATPRAPADVALAAPELTADATDATTIELAWGEVEGAVRYELWAWDPVNDWYRLGGDSLTGTAYTHRDLTAGTTYYYQVRALGAGGAEGPWSQRVSATPRAPTLTPTSTATLTPTLTPTSTAPPTATTPATAPTLTSTPTPTSTAPPTATTPASAPTPTTTPTLTPTPVALTLAAPELTFEATGATTVELAWEAVVGAARYELWAWDRVNRWYPLGGDSLTGTAYTHGNLTTGTAYYYQVRALAADGAEGPWSQRVSATPRAPADVTLAAPELTADPTGATAIELAWREVTGAVRYELWAWDPVNDWYRLGGDSLTATAYTHRDLTPGTTYYYQVRALGAGGAEGPWSQRVSATVPAASGTPLPTPTPTSTATLTATLTPTLTPTPTPTLTPTATSTPPPSQSPLPPPPASLDLDPYYRKYLDAGGIPIVAPSDVDDAELYLARGIIDGMLSNRSDIRATMAANRFRVVIFKNDGCLGPFQIPELRHERPLGGCTSVLGQATIRWFHHPLTRELLLIIDAVGAAPGALPYCNVVFVHEFAHLVHFAIAIDAAFDSGRPLFDSRFDQRLRRLYNAALAAGLYVDAYAATKYEEYWAEAVTFSFLPDALTFGVRTPAAVSKLADYDPAIARLVEEVFGSATIPDCIPAYFRVWGTVTGPAAEPLSGIIVVAQKIACASSAGRCYALFPPQQALATGRDGAYVVALRKALSPTVQRLLRRATGARDFDSSFILGVARRGSDATGECPAGYLSGAGGRVENLSRRNAALLEIPDGDLSGLLLRIAPNFDWTPIC